MCDNCLDSGYEPNDTGEPAFNGDPCTVCRSSGSTFKMPPRGAMRPPEFAWQEGKTADFIASVSLLIEAKDLLSESCHDDNWDLIKKINDHLIYLGVK